MAKWRDFVLFSLLASIATSSDNVGRFDPDHYYILESGGSYKYGHQRQDGTYERAEASQPGNVLGEFGFKDASGTDYKLEYTADQRGFQPSGDHLPSVHAKAALENLGVGFVSSDGGYTFSYETDSSDREESADPSLNVKGKFSFQGTDGRRRTIRYRAGAGTGFIAQGDHIPVSPEVPSESQVVPQTRSGPSALAPSSAPASPAISSAPAPFSSPAQVSSSSSPDGSYNFNYKTDSSDREESADPNLNVKGRFSFQGTDGRRRTIQYRAGAGTGFVVQGDHIPVSPEVPSGSQVVPQTRSSPSAPAPSTAPASPAQVSSSSSPDGSYSFNYETDSSDREESADPSLNVKGRFSFQGTDGRRRTIRYRAGAGTGFVAQGDHIPVSPEVPSGSQVVPQTRSGPSAPAPSSAPSSPATSAPAPFSSPVQVSSSSSPDGSYSFNYETDSSDREESADPNLNVKGRFSFQGTDGRRRTIRYRAGAGTGFVAQGDHIPVSPEVPSGSQVVPQTRSSPSAPAPSSAPASPAQVSSSSSPDGSYSFNYETDSSDREESADPNLNVKGRFSFQGTDGRHRTIRYRAGAGTGFVAQGDHIPVSPEVPSESQVVPQTRSGPSAPAPSSAPSSPATPSAPAPFSSPAQVSSSSSPDGSYSFNYETDSSDREESADPNLNVKGRFSFQGTDGRRRTIQYRAGAGTGFVAQGDHIPVSPEVPSGSQVVPQSGSGPTAPVPSSAPASPAQVSSSSSPDGSYSFNYETDSSDREESADPNLNVKGRFSFQGTDGRRRTIRYRAGADTGFVAQGDHIPVSAKVPSGSQVVPQTRSGPSAAVPSSASSSAPASPAQISSSSSPDGSYSFNYETDSSDREESADPSLNVKGRFSFQGTDGRRRTIRYRAGAGTGFVAQGDHIPVSPEVPSGLQVVPQTRSSPSAPAPSSAPASPVQVSSSSSPDGSYSFNYETDSSDREESADPNLNVKGRFSFQGTDGRRRTIRYRAGAGTGFVAQGDHIPVSPEVSSESKVVPQTRSGSSALAPSSAPSSPATSSAPFSSPAQVSSSSSPDGSYSFNYETDSSDREESADPNLNVKGRFSFQGTDGRRRTIQYRAGAGTGFVAQGDHIPISPEVPSGSQVVPQTRSSPSAPAPSSAPASPVQVSSSSSSDGSYSFNYETDSSDREESADPNLNVKGRFSFQGTDGRRRTIQYRAGAGTGFVAQGDHIPVSPEVPSGSQVVPQSRSGPTAPVPSSAPVSPAQVSSSSSPDGSYSFNYETDSSDREESADPNLNVKGRFSFQGTDGRRKTIRYRAGADTGFVAQGDHIPVSPEVPAGSQVVPQTKSGSSKPSQSSSHLSFGQSSLDGTYSFNYETDSSNREESADSDLNVKGRFSFRADDGRERTIQYRAGAGLGFVAEGDHLPILETGTPGFPTVAGGYKFGYETDSSTREENADQHLNVRGRYSFQADDGLQRVVTYKAGADTGFLAEGDHLPVVN
ncbi:flocculation protein FLO11-like [Penaeus chinensis]|uniref:flocculation protein FLO11-like n=1 Tax=Penaeus chinensis TaxID=139456 RepID=UPI001FB7BD52|nr:flocculation protein FLO11-like [Penaeus chinensis]